MIYPDRDLMVVMERRKDEMRAAEQYRLFHQARGSSKPRVSISLAALALARALAYLGEHFLAWSARLQCRYHRLASPEMLPEPCA